MDGGEMAVIYPEGWVDLRFLQSLRMGFLQRRKWLVRIMAAGEDRRHQARNTGDV
jgi:hypothetical protein